MKLKKAKKWGSNKMYENVRDPPHWVEGDATVCLDGWLMQLIICF